MKDQNEFLRQMQELVEFGRTKDSVLTKEEISDYCEDMNLTKEQLELVFAYLDEHKIYVPGFSKKVEKETEKEPSEDDKYLRVYRKELRALPEYTKEEIEQLFKKLREGDEEVVSVLVEAHLSRVVTLAGKYRNHGVPLLDLIQEGNLELMLCVSSLCGNAEVTDYKKAIDHAVRSRMMELVDEELANGDKENTVLARTNLLLEATHTLAEELGRIATIEELAEFTHMDEAEIQMYVELSRDNIEIGKGDGKNV